jgi:hypothetical protein
LVSLLAWGLSAALRHGGSFDLGLGAHKHAERASGGGSLTVDFRI